MGKLSLSLSLLCNAIMKPFTDSVWTDFLNPLTGFHLTHYEVFFCNLLKWPLNLQSELRQCKMLTFMVLLGTILSREKRYSVICVFCVTWPRCVGSLSVRAGWPAHWWLERAESLSYRCSVLVTTSPCNASVTQGHVTFMTYWQMVTL